MGKGGYSGGSTIVGPWSAGWFSRPKGKASPIKKASSHAAGKVSNAAPKAKGAKRKPLKMSDARIAADAEERRLRKSVRQSAPVNMTGVATRSRKQKKTAASLVELDKREAQRLAEKARREAVLAARREALIAPRPKPAPTLRTDRKPLLTIKVRSE